MQLVDSLIPDEYRLVKNKGVLGLECHDESVSPVLSIMSINVTLYVVMSCIMFSYYLV